MQLISGAGEVAQELDKRSGIAKNRLFIAALFLNRSPE